MRKKGVIIWQEVHIIYQEIRNGESRFFNVFSPKALVITAVFALLGVLIASIVKLMVSSQITFVIIVVCFGGLGFAISSFKIPDSNSFEITRKAGGEYVDQIILRYIRFKRKKNKIYTIFEEEKKQEK